MLLAALFDVRLFLQDVPDLFQQNDVIRLGRGGCGRFFALAPQCADELDGHEDGEGDDDEVDGRLKQFPVFQFHVPQFQGQGRQVHAGGEVADDGGDDAGDEDGNDFVERAADDDRHRQVNDVSFKGECLEFLQKTFGIEKMCHDGLLLVVDLFWRQKDKRKEK